jgi:alpha-L-fucosidase
MGQWLEKYGYTLYGTRGGPFQPTDWGVSTRKGDKIYLHVLRWHGDHPEIWVPDPGRDITAYRLVERIFSQSIPLLN